MKSDHDARTVPDFNIQSIPLCFNVRNYALIGVERDLIRDADDGNDLIDWRANENELRTAATPRGFFRERLVGEKPQPVKLASNGPLPDDHPHPARVAFAKHGTQDARGRLEHLRTLYRVHIVRPPTGVRFQGYAG